MNGQTTSSAFIAPSAADTAGSSEAEAQRRLAQYGENALAEHHVSGLERLARFFWGATFGQLSVGC